MRKLFVCALALFVVAGTAARAEDTKSVTRTYQLTLQDRDGRGVEGHRVYVFQRFTKPGWVEDDTNTYTRFFRGGKTNSTGAALVTAKQGKKYLGEQFLCARMGNEFHCADLAKGDAADTCLNFNVERAYWNGYEPIYSCDVPKYSCAFAKVSSRLEEDTKSIHMFSVHSATCAKL